MAQSRRLQYEFSREWTRDCCVGICYLKCADNSVVTVAVARPETVPGSVVCSTKPRLDAKLLLMVHEQPASRCRGVCGRR